MPPDPPTFRKSMSSIIFIANEKAFKVLIYCRAANFCVRFIYTTYESQAQVTNFYRNIRYYA